MNRGASVLGQGKHPLVFLVILAAGAVMSGHAQSSAQRAEKDPAVLKPDAYPALR